MGAKLEKVGEITKTSLQLTSIKGIGRALRMQYMSLKIIWIVFILAFFIIACYIIYLEGVEYFQRQTVINFFEKVPSDRSSENMETFPSTLLCNLKPVHIEDDESVFGVQDYLSSLHANITSYERIFKSSFETKVVFEKFYRAAAYADFIGRETAISYGQTLEDFIQMCTVTSSIGDSVYSCSEVAIIEPLFVPHYFNCFIICMRESSLMTLHPRKLSVVLHLNADEDYINSHYSLESNDFQSSGALVLLYTRGIDLTNLGLRLHPGTLSTISFTMSKRKRLTSPYGTCVYQIDRDLLGVPDGTKMKYNQLSCISACLQEKISQQCGCFQSETRAVFMLSEMNQTQCAGPQRSFKRRMRTQVCALLASFQYDQECDQMCPKECEEMLLPTTLSTSQWPSYSQQLAFYEQAIKNKSYADKYAAYDKLLQELNKGERNITDTLSELQKLTKIEKNFVKVDFVLSSSILTVVTNEIKVTHGSLISSVASFMNMFSGITLIVVVEIIDYIIHVIYAVCSKSRTGKDKAENGVNGISKASNTTHDFEVHL